MFRVRVTSTALLLQVKKPCPESDGSEPQNPRYGTGGPTLTGCSTVAERKAELCCGFVAPEPWSHVLHRTSGWISFNGFHSERVFFPVPSQRCSLASGLLSLDGAITLNGHLQSKKTPQLLNSVGKSV